MKDGTELWGGRSPGCDGPDPRTAKGRAASDALRPIGSGPAARSASARGDDPHEAPLPASSPHAPVAAARLDKPARARWARRLPGGGGWDSTIELKADEHTSSIPVLALTAHSMSGDRERAIAAGCDDFDTKPIDLPRLLEKIEKLLAP